ncbi:MAG: 2-(3-amino-3-carboxypropyl)histidine synthase subunit [Nanoarchaeota archaeon]|nr:2-(3-amino-3-carboxypropyl)histidine synthase subunit [Nanoarchaeota archaeon]MBU1028344.1 2-(3-amino-3-carboxypropyl)histidine synthase subunit [Nanoarchaeota archaeon]
MKTIFIPAKVRSEVNKAKILEISKKLPKTISIAYSIQYQNIVFEIEKILSKNHEITKTMQVLGCSKPKLSKTTQAILLVGSGRFHAISLAQETKLPIYILEQNQLYKISKKDIETLEKKQKASFLKFLHANKIGILISTKPGQQNLKKALEVKNKIKNKKSYLFLGDNINSFEFENFKIDSWINTSCPRLDMDSRIVNVSNLKKLD